MKIIPQNERYLYPKEMLEEEKTYKIACSRDLKKISSKTVKQESTNMSIKIKIDDYETHNGEMIIRKANITSVSIIKGV